MSTVTDREGDFIDNTAFLKFGNFLNKTVGKFSD